MHVTHGRKDTFVSASFYLWGLEHPGIGRVSSDGRLDLARKFRSFFLWNETGEGGKRRLHSSARHSLSHGATSRWHRRQGASSSPSPQRRRPASPPSDPQKIRLLGCWPRWRQPPSRCLDSSPSQQHVASSREPKLRTRADKQFASRHGLGDSVRATWCVPERRPAAVLSVVLRTFRRGVPKPSFLPKPGHYADRFNAAPGVVKIFTITIFSPRLLHFSLTSVLVRFDVTRHLRLADLAKALAYRRRLGSKAKEVRLRVDLGHSWVEGMGNYSSRTGNCKSVGQVLRHVVSFKHQGEQARPGEQATPQELAKPGPPELFPMPLSNMEQFCAAEAQLKNFTNRTLPDEQLVSLGDSKNLQKVVREMVGRLFSKQVQEQFSLLLGYRGKSRFKDAMMCKVVIGRRTTSNRSSWSVCATPSRRFRISSGNCAVFNRVSGASMTKAVNKVDDIKSFFL
ncbi:hypothetical protein HPB47_004981 [Ixodes persulcatus]|uniref:Uncharacterized protein n=1 Tax=Ixodes persulcatus TaxID=34615 RepID=A0AC60PF43_IXOPE|nr:hypothetical protein HPB47_004981 [Ixodes persulcatus]